MFGNSNCNSYTDANANTSRCNTYFYTDTVNNHNFNGDPFSNAYNYNNSYCNFYTNTNSNGDYRIDTNRD
jgi:hypothetical protein